MVASAEGGSPRRVDRPGGQAGGARGCRGTPSGVVASRPVGVEQVLPLDVSAPRRGRVALEPFRAAIEPGRFEDLRLVVTELIANCVRHGGRNGGMSLCVGR